MRAIPPLTLGEGVRGWGVSDIKHKFVFGFAINFFFDWIPAYAGMTVLGFGFCGFLLSLIRTAKSEILTNEQSFFWIKLK